MARPDRVSLGRRARRSVGYASRSGGLVTFDPERMKADYAAVDASFEIRPFDVGSAYSNDYVDPSIKFAR